MTWDGQTEKSSNKLLNCWSRSSNATVCSKISLKIKTLQRMKVPTCPNLYANFSFVCCLDTLKCDRCDTFETISHALLLVHVTQCRGEAINVKTGSSRQFPMDVSNANTDSGIGDDAAQSTMDATSAATPSSTISMNSDSNNRQVLDYFLDFQ